MPTPFTPRGTLLIFLVPTLSVGTLVLDAQRPVVPNDYKPEATQSVEEAVPTPERENEKAPSPLVGEVPPKAAVGDSGRGGAAGGGGGGQRQGSCRRRRRWGGCKRTTPNQLRKTADAIPAHARIALITSPCTLVNRRWIPL